VNKAYQLIILFI